MLGGSGVPAGYSAVADLVGGYVRFHGGTAKPPPSYGRQALMSWARRIADVWPDEGDVYVYFNNDLGGAAVADAAKFARAAAALGRTVSRAPG